MGYDLYAENIDERLKQLMDADNRSKREITQVALWREFGGKRKSALEAQKEQKVQRRESIQHEIDVLKQEDQKLQSEIEALNHEIENMQSPKEQYAMACDELLDKLAAGEISQLRPVVCEDVANDHGKESETVWEDCKRRAAEQDRDLLETAFMAPKDAKQVRVSDQKRIADAWNGGDE